VHIEESDSVLSAIEREKQLKAWRREKKVALIEAGNPEWDDLADHWYQKARDSSPFCEGLGMTVPHHARRSALNPARLRR